MHVKVPSQSSAPTPLSSWLVFYPSAALVFASVPISLFRDGSQRLGLLADAVSVAAVA